MNALILSAGFGTRLLPYTDYVPKPLFPLGGKPVIHRVIEKLSDAGISRIVINTHHLHGQVERYIRETPFSIPVDPLYEPDILGTGGAVKNAAPFLKDDLSVIVNCDIVFDLDFENLVGFHKAGDWLSTLVVHQYQRFNKIALDAGNFIKSFDAENGGFAFTGIHVVSPGLFDLMGDKKTFSIIRLYERLIQNGHKIKAYVPQQMAWLDMGTLDDYRSACLAFLAHPDRTETARILRQTGIEKLDGDASDRRWFRVHTAGGTRIASDHGIQIPEKSSAFQSFVKIGRHLYEKGIPVPAILNHDTFAGIVMLSDLGDTHLERKATQSKSEKERRNWYKKACDNLLCFAIKGIEGFRPEWACETASYSHWLVLEKECRYFMAAFIQKYRGSDEVFDTFAGEFEFIAKTAVDSCFKGLMHRDMQSRNIMVRNSGLFFIDFQSARKGPVEYDLASLLIDPYVNLDPQTEKVLADYFFEQLSGCRNADREKFDACYRYCRVTRSLQILGAFSFLTVQKKKRQFETYIPIATDNLKRYIADIDTGSIPRLFNLVKNL